MNCSHSIYNDCRNIRNIQRKPVGPFPANLFLLWRCGYFPVCGGFDPTLVINSGNVICPVSPRKLCSMDVGTNSQFNFWYFCLCSKMEQSKELTTYLNSHSQPKVMIVFSIIDSIPAFILKSEVNHQMFWYRFVFSCDKFTGVFSHIWLGCATLFTHHYFVNGKCQSNSRSSMFGSTRCCWRYQFLTNRCPQRAVEAELRYGDLQIMNEMQRCQLLPSRNWILTSFCTIQFVRLGRKLRHFTRQHMHLTLIVASRSPECNLVIIISFILSFKATVKHVM